MRKGGYNFRAFYPERNNIKMSILLHIFFPKPKLAHHDKQGTPRAPQAKTLAKQLVRTPRQHPGAKVFPSCISIQHSRLNLILALYNTTVYPSVVRIGKETETNTSHTGCRQSQFQLRAHVSRYRHIQMSAGAN